MALPGYLLSRAVPSARAEQVQPAGIDLRVDEVHVFADEGVLGIRDRILPRTKALEPRGGWWLLGRGFYKIVFKDIVEVPSTAIGLCLPRSSLLRMGAHLSCGFWDPGYRGRGEALLVIGNDKGIRLERGARVAQLVLVRVEPSSPSVYSGLYQGERVGSAPR